MFLCSLLASGLALKGWSAAELGRRLEVLGHTQDDSTVRGWLRGDWEPPRQALGALCFLLELQAVDLLRARSGRP